MSTNKVWELVDLLEGVRPIWCKQIYKKKRNAEGKVKTYKARLVAKGYTQREGIDYEETFSLAAILNSIRIFLSIAATYNCEIWKIDIETVKQNGSLDETIYMDQPEGYKQKRENQKVCRLFKSIYGLKQASSSWNITCNAPKISVLEILFV